MYFFKYSVMKNITENSTQIFKTVILQLFLVPRVARFFFLQFIFEMW